MTSKQISIALQSSIETGDMAPTVHIHPDRYTQHNLQVGDGLSAILALHAQLPTEGVRARPLRAIEDGALVAVHVDYDLWGPKAGFDIHRFENGRIVEHWDNLQPTPSVPNPSGRTMLDGPTDNGDPARTVESKALVEAFMREVAIARRPDKADSFFHDGALIQHHPTLPDGAAALLLHVGCMSSVEPAARYEALHMVIGEGELVLAVSEGRSANVHAAFYDLFRLHDGHLAEHWSVTELIPPRAEWRNENGKF